MVSGTLVAVTRTPDPRLSEETLVVLPTYEEAENVGPLLRALRQELPKATLLVIDDASPDGTAALAEDLAASDPRIVVLRRRGKLGLGTAHRVGLEFAVDHRFHTALTMDADLSHRPADAPRLIARSKQRGVDLVVGSRYVSGGCITGWPVTRRALSGSANVLLRAAMGIGVHDCTGAFRAYDVALLHRLPLDQLSNTGYSALPELLLMAAAVDAVIVEEPITFVERQAGATKLTRREVGNSLVNVVHLYRRRRKSVRRPLHPARTPESQHQASRDDG